MFKQRLERLLPTSFIYWLIRHGYEPYDVAQDIELCPEDQKSFDEWCEQERRKDIYKY